MQIDISQYIETEKHVILGKLENLYIEYKIIEDIIYLQERVDLSTYQYLIDFSRI